jgi:hypothetical protein
MEFSVVGHPVVVDRLVHHRVERSGNRLGTGTIAQQGSHVVPVPAVRLIEVGEEHASSVQIRTFGAVRPVRSNTTQ